MLPTPPPSPGPSDDLCFDPEDRLGQTLAGRYRLTGVLGVGAYGTVYKAYDVETNTNYAVKALNKSGLDSRQRQFQEREIQLHYQSSKHFGIVSMIKILDSPECTFLVLEYLEGDLFTAITDDCLYGDDQKVKCVFLQILDAVRHCHSIGIFHRDLKPENVLVKDNGWTAKLGDFGLATQDQITSDFGCGSTFYMSPECQQPNPKPFAYYASAPNDVWSLGVILVNLACGRNPWKRASMEDSTFKAYMRDRNFLRTILPISDNLNFILQQIFEVDPRKRITLDGLRELIMRSGPLTQSFRPTSLPSTPPYSPVDKVVEPPLPSQDHPMDVPPMEPLPGQQFPPTTTPQVFTTHPAAVPTGLSSPPGSNQCSTQLSPYLFPTKPAVCPTYTGQNGFLPSLPAWARCGQLISNIHVPRPCYWSAPVY